MTKTCKSIQEKSSVEAKSSTTSVVSTSRSKRPSFSAIIKKEVVRVDDIIKPASDTRQYRALILPNQLRVLLISDPETDKAAAGMSVQVGSMADPWNRQGLAHLLEHVLFISTQKYPMDNFLKSFVSNHSGSCNAQTLPTDTVFYFDIAPSALGEALLRFGDLFTAPLFPADKVDRELAAIDFEFQNGLADDDVRAERVRQLCGDQKHIYAKFSYGNQSTLGKDSELLTDVVHLFKSHYSPGAMGLAVLGKESLVQLETMVTSAFSRLPNRGLGSPPLISTHPYSKEHCRQLIKVVPFKACRRLVLFFPIPPTIAANALDYVIWLLAHEGPGGLLAELKRLGYCSTIKVTSPYHHGFGFLNIELVLTQGITKNVEIITVLFQYLRMLREEGHKETYDEMKAVRDIKFHYRDTVEPMTYVYNLCFNLHVSLQRCVLGRAFPTYLKEEVDFVLQLLTPQSLNIQVISPLFAEVAKQAHSGFTTDPLYGIQYSVEPIQPELLSTWSTVPLNLQLHMPPKNSLIPRDFTLKIEPQQPQNTMKNSLTPVCISGNRVRVWHLTDSSTYRAPKAFIGFLFRSGDLHSSPLNLDFTTLFIDLYTEHANQVFFSGHLAGASYSLSANHRFGLELTIAGFSHHLEIYALMLLKELITFKIAYDRYDIHHGTLENSLKAFSTYTARYQLNYLLDTVLCSGGGWSYEEQATEMAKLTPEAMLFFLSNILLHSQVEMFTYGNITNEEALALGQEVEKVLWSASSLPSLLQPQNTLGTMYNFYLDIKLPTEQVYELQVPNDQLESGHGTLLYYQIGPEEDSLKARLELFYQLIYFAWFDQLRQKEQLAYVLSLSLKYTDSSRTMGLFAFLQSSYPLPYIASRIDAFMNGTVQALLESTSTEDLERAKASLISRLEEKPKKLQLMGERLWAEITCGQCRFDRTQKLVEAVRDIKQPKEMMDFYKEYFKEGGAKCRRLAITLKTSKCKELPTPNEVTKPTSSSNVTKRITFSDVHKLKCSTERWPFLAVNLDNCNQ